MRAAFNTLVTLYDGPGTATPFFPRVVGAQCRVVPDTYFADLQAPDNLSLSYFNIASTTPNGPDLTTTIPDVWVRDYNKSDIAEFASLPGLFWQVTRVESCTWPSPRAPYSRAHIREGVGPPPLCSTTYHESYAFSDPNSGMDVVLLRLGPNVWGAAGWFLEVIPPATWPDCLAEWRLVNSISQTWTTTNYNGLSVRGFLSDFGLAHIIIFPA